MSQAMANLDAGALGSEGLDAGAEAGGGRSRVSAGGGAGLDRQRWEAMHRPSRRRTIGALRSLDDAPYEGDTHLLDGPGWWQMWVGGLLWLLVPAMIKLIPGRPWWEFAPAFAVIAMGLGAVYYGWRVGNPIQKACCLMVALALLALGAKLGDWAIGMHIHSGSLQQMDKAYEL
ncbi:MAG: hypothetical protein AAGH92_01930 [Planctomycetota bacterium]